MTTIAYKDGVLAADTQLNISGIKVFTRKIEQLPTGQIVACAGLVEDSNNFKEWLKGDRKRFKVEHKGFEAILIEEGKVYWFDSSAQRNPMEHLYWAIGSGWQIAKAGMHAGMTAKQAVELAGDIEINTNKLVDIYDVKTKKLTLARFPR